MVTRVSSAAMKSAWAMVWAIRGEMSPRFPMGVGTKYKVPDMARTSSFYSRQGSTCKPGLPWRTPSTNRA